MYFDMCFPEVLPLFTFSSQPSWLYSGSGTFQSHGVIKPPVPHWDSVFLFGWRRPNHDLRRIIAFISTLGQIMYRQELCLEIGALSSLDY